MKINGETYDKLERLIRDTMESLGRNAVLSESTKFNGKLFRWDMYWCACARHEDDMPTVCEFKDDHIDTALRRIVPSILGEFQRSQLNGQ